MTTWTKRYVSNISAALATAYLVLLALAALSAPVVAPADPNAQVLTDRLLPPFGPYVLGTDELGRDVASRLLFAARVSLAAPLLAVSIAVVLGGTVGLIAGYRRGWIDEIAGRLADASMSIPGILLAISVIGVLGRDVTNAMIAIGLVYAPRFFRVVRASTLAVREEVFIEASRSIGTPGWRIVATHVIPNIVGPLIVEVSLAMSFALLAEGGLSFLGLGVQPPDASWGAMLGRAVGFMTQAPHMAILPGLLITITILAFNVVGDGLAEAFGVGRPER